MTGSGMAARWRDALADLVVAVQLAEPDEFPAVVNAAAAGVGVEITIYVVDHEQRALHPVRETGKDAPGQLTIDATLAGRAFMHVQPMPGPAQGHPARLWMPLLDGNERLGVLDVVVHDPAIDADDDDFRSGCDVFCRLVGHLFATKTPYGDTLVAARRTRRMSEASELLWRLLPPLTFASHQVVVAAVLEPCYEVGGDGFDYAVDDSTAFFAIFDTAGHDLRSGLGTATVLAAIRAARIDGADLPELAHTADRALARYLPELRFTTAVLGTLDLETGRLRYINAGHPPPMLLRNGKVVTRLDRGRRLPLGLDDPRRDIAEERLERGDRLLLFTDGVTEARRHGHQPFGENRLIDLVGKHTTAGLPTAETLRRLCHAVMDHSAGPPTDDATLLFVEWSHRAGQGMTP